MNSSWQFGYNGTPGTCLWCGCKLRSGRGIFGSHFHAESCATKFGVRAAALGYRLKLAPPHQAKPQADELN